MSMFLNQQLGLGRRTRAMHPRGLAAKGGRGLGPGRRIGILGGSFNPAHEGHVHISRIALRRLRLDRIWWLVSPQNPLKSTRGMASQAERIAAAQRVARDRTIRVTGLESDFGTVQTVGTLRCLQMRFPRRRFVWLMGADNLSQIPQWHDWETIFRTVPIAVLARPTYSLQALSGKASTRFRWARLPERRAVGLARAQTPAWVFFASRLHGASATEIRMARHGSARASG